jgi:N-acetyl-alpha-D-glucosaminyl L-malate synthase BshA
MDLEGMDELRPLRIGITCHPSMGGSGVLATELGKELADRGHEIHFITSRMPARLRSSCQRGIHFHEVHALHYPVFEHTPYMLALAAKLAEVYRQFRLDLFHVHYAIPHAAAAILARQMLEPCQSPIVTTLHGTDVTLVGQDPSYHPMVRFCLEKSDAVTAVSDWLADTTRNAFAPEREIRRIHNFADPKRFRPGEKGMQRASLAAPGQAIFLHVSNFRPVKRVPDVIRVFARCVALGVDGILVLAGEGPELAPALELARKLGVAERIRPMGQVGDISQILPLADLFLFPSDGESFGLAPLESLLCEVPVVGARAGGLPEVVTEGVCGHLLPVGEIEGMAQACLVLLESPERRREMGRQGRLQSLARFTPEAIVPRYEELYRELVRARKPCR